MITTITKRNGQTAPFEPLRIRRAICGAFWEYNNAQLKKEGKPTLPKESFLGHDLEQEIDTITELVVENCERKGVTTVEGIESLVEDTIWTKGHKEVSKLYIGYRQLHQHKREQAEIRYKISVTKSTGEKVPFNIEPLAAAIAAACAGIPDVSEKALLTEAENNLYDGVKTSEITESMIQAARSFIEREPAYSFVASRLLLQKLADESLSELGFEYKGSQIPVPYNEYFQTAIRQGVQEKLLDERLTSDYDLDKLAAAIVPERDLELEYMGLKTLADRYFIKSRHSRNRIELPQNFFMRVAMGLAIQEKDKNGKAIEFYNVLSQRHGMSSTPTLFNAGTCHSQLSSCFLYNIDDNIESILLNGIANNGFLSKWAGGLGGSWTNVRAAGAYIGGTNGESSGIIPFLKIHNAQLVAVNQCWGPNTPIPTHRGIIPISEIQVGDLVITESGEYSPVKEIMDYLQKGPMVEIQAKHTEPMRVTDEHPLWAITGIPAEQAIARSKNWLEKGKVKMDWVEPKHLQINDYLGTRIPTEFKDIQNLSEEIAQFYGMMLGNGHITNDSKQEAGFTQNEETPQGIENLETARKLLKKLGIHSWESTIHGGTGVIHWTWKNEVFGFTRSDLYNKKSEKEIATKFLLLPRHKIVKIIKGLIQTDGGIYREDEIWFYNSSLPLIRGFRHLLIKLGVPTYLSEKEPREPHTGTRRDGSTAVFSSEKTAYAVAIPAAKIIADELGVATITKQNWISWNGYIFTRINSIEPTPSCEKVYDLKIEGPESYCTIDVLAHNGGKRRGSGCAYLETWHLDIEEFLDLRKETGDDRRRCHDMNTANWIPDLFMKRVIEDGTWWLFSPDKTPDLHDLYGKAFEERYLQHEKEAEAGLTSEHNDELGLVKLSQQKHPLHPCKRIPAVALWKKMLAALFETGHPWITFKDAANIRSPQDHVGVIHSSNLCCIALDQRVVTHKGIFTVEELYQAKTKNIVMGREGQLHASEMLLPRPNAPMVKIITKEGYRHKVTPDHKVGINGGSQKETQNLEEGDQIELQQMEGLFGPNEMEDEALLAGFIATDGGIGTTAYIDIWENKTLHLATEIEEATNHVIQKYEGILNYDNLETRGASARRIVKFGEITTPSVQKRRLNSTALKLVLEHLGIRTENKLQVPDFVWKGNKSTVSSYLRGAILCDGSPQATNEITTMQMGSVSQTWLEELQILFINLGVKTSITPMRDDGENLLPDGNGGSKLYRVQALYRILATSIKACQILETITGLGKERNHKQYIENLTTKTGYKQKMYATFSHLEECVNQDAYCLQVNSDEHLWVVNGMLTRNTEIFENTSSSKVHAETGEVESLGETAVCNLASVNLANHIQDGKLNKTLLRSTVTTLMRMLDNVIDINFYPIPEAKNSNLKHRPVGLGVMGVHTSLQMLGIPYDSQDAIEFSDVAQELISLYAIEASSDNAADKGAYSSFKGSKWDRGIFPKDTLDLLAEDRGEEYMLADRTSAFPEEWERIKAKVKTQGMRNSNTMAVAPTATIALICGVSEGIMPLKANLSKKENLSGTFTVINSLLVEKLKKIQLWEESIRDKIKMGEGSIQDIKEIPEEVRALFKTCFEIHPSYLIECASRRQKWIDQGQSLNLFTDTPNGPFLSSMYRLAWLKGLKSTYYLRSVSASQKEKASVEVQKLGNTTGIQKKTSTEAEKQACSIEAMRNGEECEACQ